MSIASVFVLIFLILTSVYAFYYIRQSRTVIPVINEVNSNLTATTTSTKPPKTYETTPLLFPRIRWAKMPISVYVVSSNCSAVQVQEVSDAENIWTQKTNGIISFTDSNSPSQADVVVDCLKDSSSIREGRRIIKKVGEGGPSSVYDTGLFNLTTKGKIYLFTSTTGCDRPIIAIHEMGHVIGLDHSDNPSSVMHEYEVCSQEITPEIVNTIKSLYSYPAKPDLYFFDASASQKNFYLYLNMTIKNEGLVDSQPTNVSVIANGKEVKSIPLDSIKPAQGYIYSISNLFVSNEVTDLKLVIDPTNQMEELFKSNNMISLTPK